MQNILQKLYFNLVFHVHFHLQLRKNDKIPDDLNAIKGNMQLIQNNRSEQIKSYITTSKSTMATGGSASNTINALAKLSVKSGFIGRWATMKLDVFSLKVALRMALPHICKSAKHLPDISSCAKRTLCSYLGTSDKLNVNTLRLFYERKIGKL